VKPPNLVSDLHLLNPPARPPSSLFSMIKTRAWKPRPLPKIKQLALLILATLQQSEIDT
jgi:hypothetical protein